MPTVHKHYGPSQKWVALGIINTFDTVIFFIHILAIACMLVGSHKGYTALAAYILMIVYYIGRIMMHRNIRSVVQKRFKNVEKIIISPSYRFYHYHLAVVTTDYYYVARWHRGNIMIYDKFDRVPFPDNAIMRAAKQDENISAFLSFSPVYRWDIFDYDHYYEVRFIDLRYRSKDYYPFVAIVQLDHNLNIISSYTGWIFSEEKLRKNWSYFHIKKRLQSLFNVSNDLLD